MDAFAGEIRMFPYNYTPDGWLPCDGRSLSIMNYQLLYALIGITFGGDGRTNFQLPNLMGQIPVGTGAAATGTAYVFAKAVGSTTVELTTAQMGAHDHTMTAKVGTAGVTGMTGTATDTSLLSRGINVEHKLIDIYQQPAGSTQIALGDQVAVAGGNASYDTDPHPNMMPFLGMGYFICYNGDYPPPPD